MNGTLSTPVSGGLLRGFPNLEPQTSACSTASNLLSQAGSMLVLLECQRQMLSLLQLLITVINALPAPPLKARQEFAKAAANLQPCFLALTPAGLLPFVRDLLCLEIQSLQCFLQNLESVRKHTGGAVKDVLSSYLPMIGVLQLAEGLLQTVGVKIPNPPVLSTKTDKSSLDGNAKAVKDFIKALQVATDSLGGCAS
jgi:hypothetical protein